MSSNSDHQPIEETTSAEVAKERRRIIGIILTEYAECKRLGFDDVASFLDNLALKIEHPELVSPYREAGEQNGNR